MNKYIYICSIPNISKTSHGYTNEIQYHARYEHGRITQYI